MPAGTLGSAYGDVNEVYKLLSNSNEGNPQDMPSKKYQALKTASIEVRKFTETLGKLEEIV